MINKSQTWLSVKETAEEAGVTTRTVYKWFKKGLRHSKHGRVTRVKGVWLNDFFEAGEVIDADTARVRQRLGIGA